MLDVVTTATVEVAGTAVCPPRLANRLRYLAQVRGLMRLSGSVGQRFVQRMTCLRWPLLVGTGAIVADEAINLVFSREVEGFCVGPAIACVARCTARFIRRDIATERIDFRLLAQYLAGYRMYVLPGPVNRTLYLVRSLGMTGQAGCSDFRTTRERPRESLEFGVIGSRC